MPHERPIISFTSGPRTHVRVSVLFVPVWFAPRLLWSFAQVLGRILSPTARCADRPASLWNFTLMLTLNSLCAFRFFRRSGTFTALSCQLGTTPYAIGLQPTCALPPFFSFRCLVCFASLRVLPIPAFPSLSCVRSSFFSFPPPTVPLVTSPPSPPTPLTGLLSLLKCCCPPMPHGFQAPIVALSYAYLYIPHPPSPSVFSTVGPLSCLYDLLLSMSLLFPGRITRGPPKCLSLDNTLISGLLCPISPQIILYFVAAVRSHLLSSFSYPHKVLPNQITGPFPPPATLCSVSVAAPSTSSHSVTPVLLYAGRAYLSTSELVRPRAYLFYTFSLSGASSLESASPLPPTFPYDSHPSCSTTLFTFSPSQASAFSHGSAAFLVRSSQVFFPFVPTSLPPSSFLLHTCFGHPLAAVCRFFRGLCYLPGFVSRFPSALTAGTLPLCVFSGIFSFFLSHPAPGSQALIPVTKPPPVHHSLLTQGSPTPRMPFRSLQSTASPLRCLSTPLHCYHPRLPLI